MWDGVCGTHGEKIIIFRFFLGKPERNITLGRIYLKQVLMNRIGGMDHGLKLSCS